MRRLSIAIALVVATPAAADKAGPSRLEWLLDTRFTGTEVRLRAGAELRWQTDGAPIRGLSLTDSDSFRRLRDKGAGARIFINGSRVALAARVKPRHLSPVVNRRSLVRPTATAVAAPFDGKSPGVHLRAGARIEPGKRAGRATRVTVKRGRIEARGFLPNEVIAIEFVPPSTAAPKHEGQWREVKPPLALRARPGAGVIARLVGNDPIGVKVLETRGKQALIACDDERASAIGWVPVARLSAGSGTLWGTIGSGRYGGRRTRLEVGTVLSDRVTGKPIGLVTQVANPRVFRRSAGWTEVELDTEVGAVRLWASADRMESGN